MISDLIEIKLTPPYLPNARASSRFNGHRINDRLLRITTSALFDPIYRGIVRPIDLLYTSENMIHLMTLIRYHQTEHS